MKFGAESPCGCKRLVYSSAPADGGKTQYTTLVFPLTSLFQQFLETFGQQKTIFRHLQPKQERRRDMGLSGTPANVTLLPPVVQEQAKLSGTWRPLGGGATAPGGIQPQPWSFTAFTQHRSTH